MLSTFLMSTMLKNRDVKRWFRKINIFDYNYMFIPINDESHWSIVVVDFQKQYFLYYDSVEFTSREQEEAYTRKYVLPLRYFL